MADFAGIQKWLDTELKEYDRELIPTVYPELWGYEGKYLPTTGDLSLGLRGLVYGRMDMVGKAVNYGGKATSVPLVNFGITMEESKVAVGIAAADWGYFDLEAEKVAVQNPQLLQSRNLVQNYRQALEKSLREWQHIKAFAGDRDLAMAGLFSNAAVTLSNVTDNLHTITASDLYNFFLSRLTTFKKRNKLTTKATSLLISTDLNLSLSKRFGDGSGDGSPMEMLRKLVGSIDEVNELNASVLEEYGILAAGSNKDMMLLYENSSEVLDRKYYPIETTEPRLLDDQVTFRIIGYTASSEARYKQPLRAEYITYPKAA